MAFRKKKGKKKTTNHFLIFCLSKAGETKASSGLKKKRKLFSLLFACYPFKIYAQQ
jgi:hypothetical protein